MDLGDEWEDTNIDECLQHLQGSIDDKVGLREFVVMLAVGRVCRPLKGVSEGEGERSEVLRPHRQTRGAIALPFFPAPPLHIHQGVRECQHSRKP